jgi:hypothetical protein
VSECIARHDHADRVRQNRVVLAPEAGAKSCGGVAGSTGQAHQRSARRRWQQSASHRGERDISRSNHCAGKAGLSPASPVFPLCIIARRFSTEVTGASRHPVFPAPSFRKEGEKEGERMSKARAKHAARMPTHARCLRSECDVTTIVIASAAKQSRILPRRQSGLLHCLAMTMWKQPRAQLHLPHSEERAMGARLEGRGPPVGPSSFETPAVGGLLRMRNSLRRTSARNGLPAAGV